MNKNTWYGSHDEERICGILFCIFLYGVQQANLYVIVGERDIGCLMPDIFNMYRGEKINYQNV